MDGHRHAGLRAADNPRPEELFARILAAVETDNAPGRPDWATAAIAGLMTAQTAGRFGEIERMLISALLDRVRWHGDGADEYREGAFVNAVAAVEMMGQENPPLINRPA